VKHILVECTSLPDVRVKYFVVLSVEDLFESNGSHIVDFIKESHFYSARNARIASAVLATAIPSVCHTPVLCQNDGT